MTRQITKLDLPFDFTTIFFYGKLMAFTHETHTYLEHLLEGQEFADIEEDF